MADLFGSNNPGFDFNPFTDAEMDILLEITDLGDPGDVLTVNPGGTGVIWSSAASGTLAGVSAASTDNTKSTYTMSTDVDVNFVDDGGNTVLFLDESTRNVGIGTLTPAWSLVVSESTDITVAQVGAGAPLYFLRSYPSIGFNNYYSGTWKYGANSGTSYAGNLVFNNATGMFSISNTAAAGAADATATMATRLVIDNTGNVGIGTASPGYPLEVNGTAKVSTYLGAGVNPNTSYSLATAANGITIASNGVLDFGLGNSRIKDGGSSYYMAFQAWNGSAIAEVMRVAGAGYVGIGTTSPDRLLHEEVSDAGTNAVVFGQRHSHITSATATTGFGIGEEYELENASGTNRVVATSAYAFTDATNASEDASWTLQLMRAGTLATGLSLSSVGGLTINGAYTLPTAVTGTNGYVLTAQTDGSTAWAPVSGGGGSVTFGSDNQIPYTNSTSDDFDYASGFTFDGTDFFAGTNLRVNGGTGVGVTAEVNGTLDSLYYSVQGHTFLTNTNDANFDTVRLNDLAGGGARPLSVDNDGDIVVGSLADFGITASAAELNILDGATLTTTELNYVDGVTSAIQTQLDAKLSSATAASTYQPLDADLTSWAGVTRASGFDTFVATPSSANLRALVTDETGTGALVFGTSPSITTGINDANGNTIIGFSPTASANQYIKIVNAQSGVPSITVDGVGDSGINILGKGSAAGTVLANNVPIVTTTGSQTLTNKIVSHTVEPSADDTYTGENITGFNATATIAQWEAVYLSTTGWALIDADAAATAGGVFAGLAATSGTNGNPLTVVLKGVIRNDGWAWATVGAPLYLSTTAGALTETAPTGTDDVVRIVGYVLSDDCIWLNPSNDWLTKV